MRYLIALLLTTVGLIAQTTNLSFTWDAPPAQPAGSANGYQFWEKVGGGRILLGGTTGFTNRVFTVSNWAIGTSRTFAVTLTNLTGESAESVPYVIPLPTGPPTNLHPVTMSLETPVPGVIEISEDLIDWRQRIRINPLGTISFLEPAFVQVDVVQYASLPLLFMRPKPDSIPTPLPIP